MIKKTINYCWFGNGNKSELKDLYEEHGSIEDLFFKITEEKQKVL